MIVKFKSCLYDNSSECINVAMTNRDIKKIMLIDAGWLI